MERPTGVPCGIYIPTTDPDLQSGSRSNYDKGKIYLKEWIPVTDRRLLRDLEEAVSPPGQILPKHSSPFPGGCRIRLQQQQ
ncbi:hypothetical protein NDU88_003844 [Pleurodeles waltl]|uniref:Uncharacterized protein n=1 Tax=Pleurodeles waltl TaxID=8319 RepID=A0AAV7QAV8_PLEWA|nr:hypothetical protein NDU88_003844 [Pleurodeles waltl]